LQNIANVLEIEISPENPETKALLGQDPVRYEIIVANKFGPSDKKRIKNFFNFFKRSEGCTLFDHTSNGKILKELRTGSVDEKLEDRNRPQHVTKINTMPKIMQNY
jgi:hypothetical protein